MICFYYTRCNKTLIPKSHPLLKSLSTTIALFRNFTTRIKGFDDVCYSIRTLIKEQKKISSLTDLLISSGFNPSSKPVSVVTFFKRFGFSDTQLKTVVTKSTRVLFCDVSRVLRPKIEFFQSIGFSQQDVIKLVTLYPFTLGSSLNNTLVPVFNLLKSYYGCQEIASDRIKRWPSLLRGETCKYLPLNVKTLRDLGVPEAKVVKMVSGKLCFIICATTKPCHFRKVVTKLIDTGFDPSSTSFEHAVHAMAWHSELGWLKKIEVYKSLGFSEGEVNEMFKKQPISFWLSKKKIAAAAKFYFEKFKWTPSHLLKNPIVLMYSLDKRVVPRCSVLQVLALRNKVKNVYILPVLRKTEDEFLKRYVNNYKDEIPEVLDAYQGKIKFDEYNSDLK